LINKKNTQQPQNKKARNLTVSRYLWCLTEPYELENSTKPTLRARALDFSLCSYLKIVKLLDNKEQKAMCLFSNKISYRPLSHVLTSHTL